MWRFGVPLAMGFTMFKIDAEALQAGVASLLHVLRTRHRLSQREVAGLLGVQPQWLSDIKFGRKRMGGRLAEQCETAFGLSWPEWLQCLPRRCLEPLHVLYETRDYGSPQEMEEVKGKALKDFLREVDQLDPDQFPGLRIPALPVRADASHPLPILERPAQGDPLRASGYTGERFAVTENAAYLVKLARDPYILRFMGQDPTGCLRPGDYLLVDQARETTDHVIHIVEWENECVLVRRERKRYVPLFLADGDALPKIVESAPVVGVVKALVWRKL